MFSRGSYGFGMPRRRFPPPVRWPFARHPGMYDDIYMEEMARLEHESMAMSDMLHDRPYFNDCSTPLSPHMSRPRLPKFQNQTEWSSRAIRDTIRKTQIRLASKEAAKAVLQNASAEPKSDEMSIKQEKQDSTVSKDNDKIEEPIAIGPKIPAKQMWESSYRDLVSKEQNSKSSVPSKEPPKQDQQSLKSKKKINMRNKKFRPYSKRKGKPDNSGVKVKKTTEDLFPRTCQVCKIEIKNEGEDELHKETEEHKQNVNKFITGNDKASLNNSVSESMPLPTNTPECTAWTRDTGDRSENTVHFCRLCSVRMTSLQHATQHYAGKSHAKRIRLVQHGRKPYRKPFTPTHFVSGGVLGMQAKKITPTYSLSSYGYGSSAQSSNSFVQQNVTIYQQTLPDAAPGTTSINLKPSLPGDFANSMTPSGQYYCSTCNVVIEHAGKLNSHLSSKAHKQAKAMS